MMSVLIYLLLLSTIPYLSTGLYTYGIIRNASIKIPFDHGYKLEAENCIQCLCNAFNNSAVFLFTCTQNKSMNYTCQFYNFMPKRDEIQYPIYDTSIYLIKTNNTFEEKDDCCNTAYLVQVIKNTTVQRNFTGTPLRSIVEGDNNTIVAVISSAGPLLKFDKSTLNNIDGVPNVPSLKAVGYYDKKYYLGTEDQGIYVYNENLSTSLHNITDRRSAINTIRFLNSTQEMLVGTAGNGIYICGKVENDTILKNCTTIPSTQNIGQVHAIGVVNESAFYVGWADEKRNIRLYRKDQNNAWTTDENDHINHTAKISDIVIDDCKRIWAVTAESDKITIYDQNKSASYIINLPGTSLFNLIILANYTLIASHESIDGISRIQPSLNCRPPR